ncbi:hypothetical protein ElyMa_003229200 [Elysia marginata]|uniref:CUB domain-containing protein n=1 Tax=Elysia marginata TaxID=1093978 RepID=A0AAV4J2N3_9GAST|nr:hypothetical protein ElyMa_003229200 [Elysia marginata]
MWTIWTLCMLTVAYHYCSAQTLKCGDYVNKENVTQGSFSGLPSGLEAQTACNLTIVLPKGNASITVHLKTLDIAQGDSLFVYDGTQNLLASFTAMSVTGQVLVGFQPEMVFVFTPNVTKSKSTWEVDFNTEGCAISVQNSWITSLDSPSYVETSKADAGQEFQCVYTVTSFLPGGYIAAAAFTAFNLAEGSSLEVQGAQADYKFITGLSRHFSMAITPVQQGCRFINTDSEICCINGRMQVLSLQKSLNSIVQ